MCPVSVWVWMGEKSKVQKLGGSRKSGSLLVSIGARRGSFQSIDALSVATASMCDDLGARPDAALLCRMSVISWTPSSLECRSQCRGDQSLRREELQVDVGVIAVRISSTSSLQASVAATLVHLVLAYDCSGARKMKIDGPTPPR